MRVLKQLLFAAAVVICFSMAASAQGQDGKKVPDKKNPPIIVVPTPNKDRDKDKDKPKNDNKKPGMAYLRQKDENQAEII